MRAALTLDRTQPTPLHRQLYEEWRRGILDGRFRRGDRVPSTRDLASSLKLSRSTVTQAYELLLAEGYLESARGSGTFVCRTLPDELLTPPPSARRVTTSARTVKLSQFGQQLNEDYAYPPIEPGWISFAHWGPDITTFPLDLWRRLQMRHLRRSSVEMLGYAQESQGYEPLRVEIARYVSRSRAVHCSAEQVIVMNGSQQALDLSARLLLDPGDGVAVEDPCYLGARRVFAAAGAKLQPMPVDAEGAACSDLDAKTRVAYVTPSHQFPTGIAMSLNRRLELIRWAQARGVVIIEDDYDSEYRYAGAPLPALQGLVHDAPIAYCGTFSKVLYPGLRIGYLIVPRELVAPFARAKWLADRHTSVAQQAALADFLREGHLERHVRRMRRLYGLRREALLDGLRKTFGDRATVIGEAAGMHAYVRIQDATLARRAASGRVQLRPASAYYLKSSYPNDWLFGFSTLSERAIREGMKRLAMSN